MKTKITLMLVALLGVTSSLSADTPTLEERLVAYAEGRTASGLSATPYYMSDEAAHAALAEEVVTALQDGAEFDTNPNILLSPYGNTLYTAGNDSAAAEVFRAAKSYGSVQFLMRSATRAEILENLLGTTPNIYRIVKNSAAPRLGDSEIADTVAESLVGQGIVGGPNERANYGANDWIQWFDAKVLSAEKEEALALLSAEIKGLLAKPQEDNPAWSARLSALQGTYAVLSRL